MAHVNLRVQQHREALRKSGLRPIQLWVPDTRRPDFAEECRRQSRLAAEADKAEPGLHELIETSLAEIDGWSA